MLWALRQNKNRNKEPNPNEVDLNHKWLQWLSGKAKIKQYSSWEKKEQKMCASFGKIKLYTYTWWQSALTLWKLSICYAIFSSSSPLFSLLSKRAHKNYLNTHIRQTDLIGLTLQSRSLCLWAYHVFFSIQLFYFRCIFKECLYYLVQRDQCHHFKEIPLASVEERHRSDKW